MIDRYDKHSAYQERHIVITSRTERPGSDQGLVERRRIPDRRAVWRGGRRDSDWINRPADARVPLVEETPSSRRWKSVLTSIHLW